MTRVLVTTFPATGHVNPILPVLAELVRRGHRVDVSVPEGFRPVVEPTGARVLVQPSLVPAGWGGVTIPRRPDADQLARARLDLVRESLAVLPVVNDPGRSRPDVVVHDVLGDAAGRVLARAWEVPTVTTCPTFVGHETFSPYTRAVADGDAVPDPAHPAMREADAVLRSALDARGLPDVPVADVAGGVGDGTHVVFLPRAFHPEGDTFDARFHFVGPCLRAGDDIGGWDPPADGRPVVLISLGTLGYAGAEGLLRQAVEAVDRLGGHAVVSLGDLDPESVGAPGEHVELHRHVPQLAVLRHAAAFVSHGGMNSTMEALAHGVPLVAVPQTGEQRLVAARVASLACGRTLDPDVATVDALAVALADVTDSPEVADGVASVRRAVRACGGAAAAADAIEAAARRSPDYVAGDRT